MTDTERESVGSAAVTAEPPIESPPKKKHGKRLLAGIAALVILALLIGKLVQGGASPDAQEEVRQYLSQGSNQVTNVKTEYKAKYKVHDEDGRWENATLSVVTAAVMNPYDGSVEYVLVSCEICENDPYADIDIEYRTESKGLLKNATREYIDETEQLLRDLKDSGELK